METFTPSLDWGNEIITSLLWVARAWAISAVCILIALTLIARFTTWGRQFWRVTGDYFKGPESIPVWAWLGVLLLSVMVVGAHRRAVQLPGQRPVFGAADRIRALARATRRSETLGYAAFGWRW